MTLTADEDILEVMESETAWQKSGKFGGIYKHWEKAVIAKQKDKDEGFVKLLGAVGQRCSTVLLFDLMELRKVSA